MKRVIRSTSNYSERKKMQALVRFLASEGVSEYTMLTAFLDNLDVDVTIQTLENLADRCGIDLSEFEEGLRRG